MQKTTIDLIATDIVEAAAGIHKLNVNYAQQIRSAVMDMCDMLIDGSLTLADPNDKGLSEIIGDFDLKTLYQTIRNKSDKYGKEHGTDEKDRKKLASAIRTTARNNILKSQSKAAVKFVLDKAAEEKAEKLSKDRAAELSNEYGNPRYLSISLGTPNDNVARVYLTAGSEDAEFDLAAMVKRTLEALKIAEVSVDDWRAEFNKQAKDYK